MCFIQKGLIVFCQNLATVYVIEIKRVILGMIAGEAKTRGERKMEGVPAILLKTNVENMSENSLSIMLMKTMNIEAALHYVHEKKWSYLSWRLPRAWG